MSARAFLACLVAGLALLAGCSTEQEAAAPPPSTVTVTVTESVAEPEASYPEEEAPVEEAETELFAGQYFSLSYPLDWEVESAEVSKGTYIDTTIRDAVEPETLLRVDVSPGSYSDPDEVAAEVEGYLVDQPRYRRLRYEPTSFLGYDAMRWDFVVEQDGRLLRKSDIFFTTEDGDGVAVLIQAPADLYRSALQELEGARRSLAIGGETPLNDVAEEPTELADGADFCETHACIDNFDNGSGYAVQCADGMWSQSGGRPGACSYHGGVAGGSSSNDGSSGYPGDDVDDNGDGSTSNWCGASRDGDGDGLWCEGR